MFSIAIAELRMLVRNRLVAVSALLIPLGLGVYFVFSGSGGNAAFIAVLQTVLMVAMGVYVTATTTLAARRQTLFLKRLRSGVVSDSSIIAGIVGPIVIVSLVQLAIVMVLLAATADAPPANVGLVIVAVLLTEIMFTGFALATAGFTNSPEHAQVTTLPILFAAMGAAVWVAITGTEELAIVKRALPGGGIAELMITGWQGLPIDNLVWLIVPSLAWAAVAVYAAKLMFRWEPRA